jgi:histidinol dehydrogenase
MFTCELKNLSRRDRSRLLSRADVDLSEPLAIASVIIGRVRAGGDQALLSCAEEYDSFVGGRLLVDPADVAAARKRVPKELVCAMAECKERIERFHDRQRLEGFEFRDRAGVYGQKVVPLSRVGVYVPGGSASYASSVLMACVPARVAGVEEVIMCTPAKGGRVGDAVLAAADMCEVDEVYSVGGAQAIAAMAYGTETIRPVQKIVGPGGAVVSAAKLLVRNDCEIDFLAGPSEVLVVADGRADAKVLAAEMLAQLEHDPLARAILVTTSRRVLKAVSDELKRLTLSADRRDIIEQSSREGAVFMLARNLREAIGFANDYAPEHLVLEVSSPKATLKMVRNAGSVFLGRNSSVAFGDYCAGPNHILPTKGTASRRSSLTTYDFLKVVPYQSITRSGARELAPICELMADAEGLPGHAKAAAIRGRSGR